MNLSFEMFFDWETNKWSYATEKWNVLIFICSWITLAITLSYTSYSAHMLYWYAYFLNLAVAADLSIDDFVITD